MGVCSSKAIFTSKLSYELLGVKGDKQMIILMLKYTVYNVKLF
jgi:hypothetical protein